MAIDTIFIEGGISRQRSLGALLARAAIVVRAWSIRRRTRHALIEMTEDQLRDIGINRAEARQEIGKSFYWD